MPAHEILSAWESFYVIVGSSAAALTGLQFVVIALVNEADIGGGDTEVNAFSTPTVVHFSSALFASAVLSAPWKTLGGPSTTLAIAGALGVLYTIVVLRRARRSQAYTPVLEDWIWHVILPFVAYVAVLVGALELRSHPEGWLFAIGAAALLLMYIGIHNAWDTVTFIATIVRGRRRRSSESPGVTDADATNAPAA
ncbi:MAG TPA: hypothetical protein VJ867_06910 [Gemmatimonadaceae bacterium]|nr:hypothetical protein [Gemmatimonadaceae bacterium]